MNQVGAVRRTRSPRRTNCRSGPRWRTRGVGSGGQAIPWVTGELAITRPMPSLPPYFWDDAVGSRYHDAYWGLAVCQAGGLPTVRNRRIAAFRTGASGLRVCTARFIRRAARAMRWVGRRRAVS